ncbi:major facilitator superfamily domain-containing protein [Gamsiella multidivaricata]|uniref:major facilitator superfamily domain-containing protein n=1 Tax=Gamsiella multidivaricata TaxID=101098 RepID=UPI002220F98D|nr:major facilitator superfamily domain-containing protein [Gamsiella multidivaricata]KAG0354725.1 hypothetical protein BGZ54_001509 [Gamsiella multidivaricata]KAI7820672.1 major facilitator superfamily domain-containing protein [Gamsiella multidivaricata]
MARPDQETKDPSAPHSNTAANVETDMDSQLTAAPKNERDIDALRKRLRPIMLYVVSTAQFLDVVNGASVSIAIIPIADHLKFSVALMPWILNAYTIAFAGLLLFSGRMGDLYGHRPMFLFGLFWFATWALVVSFATSPIMFVIARALQGIGAAATVPTAMALIATNYPAGPERAKAFSVFAAFGGLGAVVGVLMAGGLIASIGWEWIFRVSSIAAFVLLLMAFLVIPVVPRKEAHVDFLGSITSVLGVTGIVYYITMGNEDGWASPKTLPMLIAGLLLIGAFLWVETRVVNPIMPFRIWESSLFATSVVLAFIQMGMIQGFIFYANMIFQEVYGWSAIKTAVGFIVHALLAIVVFPILGRTIPRLRLKPLILVGFILRCAAALMFAFVTEDVSYWRLPFPALIVHIIGMAFSLLPIQLIAVRDAPNQDQGLVGAIYNTGLQLGAPFGIAILNVISISTNGQQGGGADGSSVRGGPQLMKGFKNSLFGVVAFGVFAFLLSLATLPWDRPGHRSPAAGKPEGEELRDLEEASVMEKKEEKEEKKEKEGKKEKEEKEEEEEGRAVVESLALNADLVGVPPQLTGTDQIERETGDCSTITSRADISK